MAGSPACTKRCSVEHSTDLRTTRTRFEVALSRTRYAETLRSHMTSTRYQSRPTETHDEETLRGRATLSHYDHARNGAYGKNGRLPRIPVSAQSPSAGDLPIRGWIYGERDGGCAGRRDVGTSPSSPYTLCNASAILRVTRCPFCPIAASAQAGDSSRAWDHNGRPDRPATRNFMLARVVSVPHMRYNEGDLRTHKASANDHES
jgi:hypothetical protein